MRFLYLKSQWIDFFKLHSSPGERLRKQPLVGTNIWDKCVIQICLYFLNLFDGIQKTYICPAEWVMSI